MALTEQIISEHLQNLKQNCVLYTVSRASQLADKLTIKLLELLSNVELCDRYLAELNQKIAKEFDPGYKKFLEIYWSKSPLITPHIGSNYHHAMELKIPPYSFHFKQVTPEDDEKIMQLLNETLQKILLAQEHKHGVNVQCQSIQQVPVFIGGIPDEKSDQLVSAGYLGNDWQYDVAGFMHGAFSHRIQHYCATRALEDGKLNLDDILAKDQQKAIFKYLVTQQTKTSFMRLLPKGIYTRSHWNLALDNDFTKEHSSFSAFYNPDKSVINNLAGPMMLGANILTETNFKEKPFLTWAIYDSFYSVMQYYSVISGNTAFNIAKIFGSSLLAGGLQSEHALLAATIRRKLIEEGHAFVKKLEGGLLYAVKTNVCAATACSNNGSSKCGDCETICYCSKKCQVDDHSKHMIACIYTRIKKLFATYSGSISFKTKLGREFFRKCVTPATLHLYRDLLLNDPSIKANPNNTYDPIFTKIGGDVIRLFNSASQNFSSLETLDASIIFIEKMPRYFIDFDEDAAFWWICLLAELAGIKKSVNLATATMKVLREQILPQIYTQYRTVM